ETELGDGSRCFVAMRYWHPLTEETVAEVEAWAPDEIVCLPLYPQYSTTTTQSSLAAWRGAMTKKGIDTKTYQVETYPTAQGLIAALAGLIAPILDDAAPRHSKIRLLLSAHGLPLKIVQAGDPYPGQVEATAEAVTEALTRPGLDWTVCYQSRV